MGYWTNHNPHRESATPLELAALTGKKALTVFDMVAKVDVIDRSDTKSIRWLVVHFKSKPANSPFISGSEMMADYPEREVAHEGQDYMMKLTGDSAQRFFDGYIQYLERQKRQSSGHHH